MGCRKEGLKRNEAVLIIENDTQDYVGFHTNQGRLFRSDELMRLNPGETGSFLVKQGYYTVKEAALFGDWDISRSDTTGVILSFELLSRDTVFLKVSEL